MAEPFDIKKLRGALEKALGYKKKYEDLLGSKSVSEQLVSSVSENLGAVLEPVLTEIADAAKNANESLVKGIREALAGDDTNEARAITAAIQSGFRGLRLPAPRVEVKVPEIKLPAPAPFVMPETIKAILEYDAKRPMPVILMGLDGQPFQFSSVGGGGGQAAAGGRGDFFTLSYTSNNPLPVSVVSGGAATTAVNISDSSGVGYSGSNPLPVVFSSTGSTASALIDSSGVQYSGSNPLPVGGTVIVSSVTATTSTRLDTPDGLVSAANPLPITIVSGALTSTVVVGDTQSGTTDSGTAPQKVGGIARTTNPTAVADGQRVSASFDSLGRQLFRPVQVRGLLSTAYVTITNGSETTLLASGAGVFNDLLYIMGANTSNAAVQIDVRDGTGGGIVLSLYIPANSTAGLSLPVPIPQNLAAQSWTVDMGDFTNSNVLISALFSKEI